MGFPEAQPALDARRLEEARAVGMPGAGGRILRRENGLERPRLRLEPVEQAQEPGPVEAVLVVHLVDECPHFLALRETAAPAGAGQSEREGEGAGQASDHFETAMSSPDTSPRRRWLGASPFSLP
jgi:hypothetical protein